MDPISGAERLALLLRQRLQERARAAGAGARTRAAPRPGQDRIDPLRALAPLDPGDERQMRRVLIQTLLADALGAELINEAQFQQVVDSVAAGIEGDEAASRLLDRVMKDLRNRP